MRGMQKVQRPIQKKIRRGKPQLIQLIQKRGNDAPRGIGNEAHKSVEAWQGTPVICWVSRGPLLLDFYGFSVSHALRALVHL